MAKWPKFVDTEEMTYVKCSHIEEDTSYSFIAGYGMILFLQKTNPPFSRLVLCPECAAVVKFAMIDETIIRVFAKIRDEKS